MKLYYKDKLKIIEMYEIGITQVSISKQYEVSISTIERIVSLYNKHGFKYLRDKSKNSRYTAEFKLELVQRVLSGESKSFVGLEYGINAGTIYAWCERYNDLGYNGLKQDLRGAHMSKKPKPTDLTKPATNEDEIKRLEEENEQLKMEIDLLKKLNALVRQRKEQPNKKKLK
ncbi:helix-turn-helix domain-containing protein [Acholeplasma laidlawii]|uniref:helix-turn-helix domain-containing protein n=1 Tax=Acholeplasma laidlawii TaxID=2148 RepID=UPI0018C313BB|nr:helix-turn-helix domain-containing protein [Acholeplasma laidlawii]MBG0762422.1 helix-turn-helix domain-containing protein [Acholeplasma laidlawii]